MGLVPYETVIVTGAWVFLSFQKEPRFRPPSLCGVLLACVCVSLLWVCNHTGMDWQSTLMTFLYLHYLCKDLSSP